MRDAEAVISPGNVRAAAVKDTPGLASRNSHQAEKQAKLVSGAKPEVLVTEVARWTLLREDFNPATLNKEILLPPRFCYGHF